MRSSNGLDTPKDLNSRIKILELFVLHILPANLEWDYARSYISNSDILDEERRDAFMQTLNELQEAKEQEEADAAAEQDLVGFAEETEDEEIPDPNERIRMDDEEAISDGPNGHKEPASRKGHHRSSSEVDYGIEDDLLKTSHPQAPSATHSIPQSTATTKATSTASASERTLSPVPSVPPPSTASATSRPALSPPRPSQTTRKPGAPIRKGANSKSSNGRSTNNTQLSKIIRIIMNITSTIASSLTRNPTQVFRTLMFVFAFLAVLARKDVRDRLKRIIGQGWTKVQQTAGMGVKVSYV